MATAWWLHSDCMATAKRLHGDCTATAHDCKQLHSNCQRTAEQPQSDCTVTAQQLHGNCTATTRWLPCATLFLVLRCQENMTQGGLVAARGGFHKWKEIKFNKILFCRILLLVTQFIAPPVAVTQPHVVCPPTAQWLPVTARWLPCTCQMTALSLFDNCLATGQQLYGNWTVTARWLGHHKFSWIELQ